MIQNFGFPGESTWQRIPAITSISLNEKSSEKSLILGKLSQWLIPFLGPISILKILNRFNFLTWNFYSYFWSRNHQGKFLTQNDWYRQLFRIILDSQRGIFFLIQFWTPAGLRTSALIKMNRLIFLYFIFAWIK